MNFLQPEALFGIFALALPAALYFLRSRRRRRLPWAAVKFLRSAVDRVPPRNRKSERNLAVIRCLIILLLSLVFARPVLNFSGTNMRMATGEANAVIVLDDSGSMLFRKGARSSFDEARESASKLMRNLDPGSMAAFCPGSGSPAGQPLRLESDFLVLRKKLEAIRPGEKTGDLWPGIRAAVDLLSKQGEGRKEIFVITDNQVLAWKRIGEIQALMAKNEDILFQVVPVGDVPANNLAITHMTLDGGVPAADKSIGCHVTVSNFGNAAVEGLRVTLCADQLPASDQAYIEKIEPGKSVTVRLFVTLPGPGAHSLTASIPPDSLAYDNSMSVAVETIKQINILLVEGSMVPLAMDRDGYFLAQALAPVPPEQRKNYYIQVNTATLAELWAGVFKAYQVVILSNVSKLAPSVAQALSSFVEEGGGLAIFTGPNTDLLYYNNDRLFSGLLPAKLGTPQNAPAEQKFISWQKGPFTHAMMKSWREQPDQSLAQVQVRSYFPLNLPEGPEKADSSVVLAFADGRPAVVEKRKGEGRVILFGSTATPRWNNLPLHPAFVPLVQSMAGYLSERKDSGLVLEEGLPFVRTLPTEWIGKDFKVEGPAGSLAGKMEKNGNAALLKVDRTTQAGVYSVFLGESTRPDFIFAVQADPKESDLRKMPPRELAEVTSRSAGQKGTKLVIYQKTGHELWMELGLLILALALAEVILSYRLNLTVLP